MNRAFVFPGQGSQVVGMGKDLYDNFSVAREVFEEVDEALNQPLSKIIFENSADQLNLTENTQPALMATSLATIRVILKETNKKLEDLCRFVGTTQSPISKIHPQSKQPYNAAPGLGKASRLHARSATLAQSEWPRLKWG